jgi:hypothetical protein
MTLHYEITKWMRKQSYITQILQQNQEKLDTIKELEENQNFQELEQYLSKVKLLNPNREQYLKDHFVVYCLDCMEDYQKGNNGTVKYRFKNDFIWDCRKGIQGRELDNTCSSSTCRDHIEKNYPPKRLESLIRKHVRLI